MIECDLVCYYDGFLKEYFILKKNKKNMIVGVSGGSGSGKTTVIELLKEDLSNKGRLVSVLSQDAYYRELASLSLAERSAKNFDSPEALDLGLLSKHLKHLAQGKSIQQPVYNFKTHMREKETVTIVSQSIILFDGMFSLANQTIKALVDYVVFVNAPDDLRFVRRLKRDLKERGRCVDNVIQQYLSTVRPMYYQHIVPISASSDYVINWEKYCASEISTLSDMMVEWEKDSQSKN